MTPGAVSNPRVAAADRAQARAADPGASVWVAASAGTGKTKVLTDRVLALMLSGTAPDRILCLTFTKAAAAEMANRINQRLARWTIAGEEELGGQVTALTGGSAGPETLESARRLFAHVLDVPGGMKIQTIHSFCQSLLKRFPLEAGLAPHFEVMDERTAAELLDEAQKGVVSAAHAGGDPTLSAALGEVSGWLQAADFQQLMDELTRGRGTLRRALSQGGVDGAAARLRRSLGVGPDETPESIRAAAQAEDALEGPALRRAAELLAGGAKTDVERGGRLAAWLSADAQGRLAGWDDWCSCFLTDKGEIRKTQATRAVNDAHPDVVEVLEREAGRLLDVIRRCQSACVATASEAALRLGERVLGAYELAKAARGLLDYDDLVLAARDLLGRERGASWVHYKLDGGIDHILIDEAQDTNPEQWAVVAALAEEFFAGEGARDHIRTVFAVGDRKQSIFSFQGADPAAFQRMRDHFAGQVQASGEAWRPIDLTVSFRSVPAVLKVVDAVFASAPARSGVADGETVHHESVRDGHAGLVEIWPPVSPAAAPEAAAWPLPLTRYAVQSAQARLARVVAGRIRRWIDNREMLPARGRPLRAGDVMVLVRRRSAFVAELVRALKACGVPVAGVDRMLLTEQIAVMDLVALGQALLMPEDDLTLATVLKSPLFGFDDDALFALCRDRGAETLWHRLTAAAGNGDPRCAAAARTLAELLARTDYLTPFELYAEVLGARRGRESLLRRLGDEANDPIDEFVALAQLYERSNVPSLQGFLHWISAGRTEVKRDLEQAMRNEVRIMTVHGAKGLQAPVVVLPDTMQTPKQSDRLYWPGEGEAPIWPPRSAMADAACPELRNAARTRQEEEYRRLLYVALTRAEDRLHICGWTGERQPPEDCWYRLVANGVLDLPGEAVEFDFAADAAVAAAGWSGPGWRLEEPQTVTVAEVGDEGAAGGDAEPLPDWARHAPAPEPEPPRPLLPSRPSVESPPPDSPLAGDAAIAYRRGRFVHRLLEVLAGLPDAERDVAGSRLLEAGGHGLDAPAASEALTQTLTVLREPAFAALFGPESVAEVPLIGRVGTTVVSGRIDRLHVAAEAVRVVDFKTGRIPQAGPSAAPAAYLRQLAAYRALLRGIYPDRPIRCALLWTDLPLMMVIPDAVLDPHAP
ncbi:MAG: double-strand break repair helicase AddA [Acetobacterales bacterium]